MARVKEERDKESVSAAIEAGEVGLQALQKGFSAARKRIDELEDQLEEALEVRTQLEKEVATLGDKLRKIQLTLS